MPLSTIPRYTYITHELISTPPHPFPLSTKRNKPCSACTIKINRDILWKQYISIYPKQATPIKKSISSVMGAFKSTYSLTISTLYKLQQLLTSISHNWGLPISTFKMVLHAPIHQFVLFSCLVFWVDFPSFSSIQWDREFICHFSCLNQLSYPFSIDITLFGPIWLRIDWVVVFLTAVA